MLHVIHLISLLLFILVCIYYFEYSDNSSVEIFRKFPNQENYYESQQQRSLSSSVEEHSISLCNSVQSALFHGHLEAKQAIRDWHRFLPTFYYVMLHKMPTNPTKEVELEFGLPRFDMLGPIGPSCKTPIESYGVGDMEKRVCGLKQLIKINSESEENYECVIYSIGSNNQWGFEEAIFAQTNCRVETFDCTISESTLPPESIRSRVRFHHYCLGAENQGNFRTWPELHAITGLKKSLTFLKMDIEGYEFPVMQSIIDSGVTLPLQIAMEIHLERLVPGKNNYEVDRRLGSGELAAFMDYMHFFGGYYLIDRNDNTLCGVCSEVLLAKLDCTNHPLKVPAYSSLKAQNHTLLSKSIAYVMGKKYYN